MLSSDAVIRLTWQNLASDFTSSSHFPRITATIRQRVHNGARACRTIDLSDAYKASPYECKMLAQLAGFGKRWRFRDDVFSDEDLIANAERKFRDAQASGLCRLPSCEKSHRVLSEARRICRTILADDFDWDELAKSSRFGSKAAVGVSRLEGALHKRVQKLSGTRQQFAILRNLLRGDQLLKDVFRGKPTTVRLPRLTRSLSLQCVPKSYKAFRTITPDTVVGNLLSNGYGDMVTKRLAVNAGLDIAVLQERHKRLARSASIRGHLVTADMSMASDRISYPLLRRVIPSTWFRLLKEDKVRVMKVGEGMISLTTFMTMGKGYTFPLQTLLFYCLLKSIQNLTGIRGVVSVYGDDLIYPVGMHRYVSTVFPLLGLILNQDKTFASGCFRESCGGDFNSGLDVRPYSPEGQYQVFTRRADYADFLYRVINGLLLRWEWWEIPITLRWLLTEVHNLYSCLFIVPSDASTGSGLRCSYRDQDWVLLLEEGFVLSRIEHVRREFADLMGGYEDVYTFQRIGLQLEKERVDFETPYYWESLRVASQSSTPPVLSIANVQAFDNWANRPPLLFPKTLQGWETLDGNFTQKRPFGVWCRGTEMVITQITSRENPGRLSLERGFVTHLPC